MPLSSQKQLLNVGWCFKCAKCETLCSIWVRNRTKKDKIGRKVAKRTKTTTIIWNNQETKTTRNLWLFDGAGWFFSSVSTDYQMVGLARNMAGQLPNWVCDIPCCCAMIIGLAPGSCLSKTKGIDVAKKKKHRNSRRFTLVCWFTYVFCLYCFRTSPQILSVRRNARIISEDRIDGKRQLQNLQILTLLSCSSALLYSSVTGKPFEFLACTRWNCWTWWGPTVKRSTERLVKKRLLDLTVVFWL